MSLRVISFLKLYREAKRSQYIIPKHETRQDTKDKYQLN